MSEELEAQEGLEGGLEESQLGQEVENDGGSQGSDEGGTEAPSRSLIEQFESETGYKVGDKYRDDGTFIRSIGHLMEMTGRQGAELKEAREILNSPEFQEWRASRTKQPEQPKGDGGVEYDPNWIHQVTKDPETGKMVAKEGCDPSIPEKLIRFANHKQKVDAELYGKPGEFVLKHAGDKVRQMIREELQQGLGSYQQVAAANDFVNKNASWLFNDGQSPRNGFTKEGQAFKGYCEEAASYGITNDAAMAQYAWARLEATRGRQPQSQPKKTPPAAKVDHNTTAPKQGDGVLLDGEDPFEAIMRQLQADPAAMADFEAFANGG